MESLYILIPIAMVFTFAAIRIFIWAIDSKQYEDLNREANRIFEEDDNF